jgi:hypothetical protein
MNRRSPFGPAGFPIRRGFEPSRSQLRTLAFAFEQALPPIRKNPITSKNLQAIESLNSHLNSGSAASGARP